jgi:hypothetical protein
MIYGNAAVVFMVISVVAVVLGIAFAGMYCLNRGLDRNAPVSGGRDGQGG